MSVLIYTSKDLCGGSTTKGGVQKCIMRLLTAILLLLCTSNVYAQPHIYKRLPVDMTAAIVAKYTHKMDSLKDRYRVWHIDSNKALTDPYFHMLMGGTSLFRMPYHRMIGRREILDESPTLNSSQEGMFAVSGANPTTIPLSKRPNDLLDLICNELSHAYGSSPNLVKCTLETVVTKTSVTTDVPKEATHIAQKNESLKHFNISIPTFVENDAEESKLVVVRPNFWTFKSAFSLQFMQTYVSPNWYKSGESNFSLLGGIVFEANYNNKQKLAFDNKLEMKLGVQDSRSDTYHKFKSNADLLRLTNKLGYRAASHWYYTMMLQTWTQFYPSYKNNDPKVYAAFMSPFESLLSFGMDYKLKSKKFAMNLTFSPIAANFRYVKRGDLATTFNIDEGKHSLFKIGSNITGTLKWDISKNIAWESRVYFFSDYKTIQTECENTINFRFNRYFSTMLFIYPRFDNAVEIKDNGSYFQLKEYLSIGLNFSI